MARAPGTTRGRRRRPIGGSGSARLRWCGRCCRAGNAPAPARRSLGRRRRARPASQTDSTAAMATGPTRRRSFDPVAAPAPARPAPGTFVLAPSGQHTGQQALRQRFHDAWLAFGGEQGSQLALGLAPVPAADSHRGPREREPVLAREELGSLGELEAVLDVALRLVESTGSVRRAGGVDARSDGHVSARELLEDLDRPCEVVRAPAVSGGEPCAAEVHEGVAAQLGAVELLSQGECALGVLDGQPGWPARRSRRWPAHPTARARSACAMARSSQVAVLAEHGQRPLDRVASGVRTDSPQRGAGVGDECSGELLRVVLLAGDGHGVGRARPARRRSGSAGTASEPGA